MFFKIGKQTFCVCIKTLVKTALHSSEAKEVSVPLPQGWVSGGGALLEESKYLEVQHCHSHDFIYAKLSIHDFERRMIILEHFPAVSMKVLW